MKRILSIISIISILFSCLVFTVPTSTAATAGSYNVTIYTNCSDDGEFYIMKVKYSYFGDEGYVALCGLSEERAQQIYEEVKKNRSCQWGELISEDIDSFGDILDSFIKS